MTASYSEAYITALAAMDKFGRPNDLNGIAADNTKWIDPALVVDDDVLARHLQAADLNDPLRSELRTITARWDAAVDPAWGEGTRPNTRRRRDVINRLLKLSESTAAILDDRCPVAGVETPTVIAHEWVRWYTTEVRSQRTYYWAHYEQYLQKKGWSADARASLDIATDRVVERLTDPTQAEIYKAKGLVVGYVQSGKTANFTGVVAKAIDAGYRLIIVLTGTTDLLRAQTQRRLDMELVGRENILMGVDEDDHQATDGLDYQDDQDWIDRKFLEHGALPRHARKPNIHRLTTQRGDYKSLRQGILALDFPLREEGKPIYDPENLFTTDARLAVVKKNGYVLNRLVTDLKRSAARIEDLPALIIDDESDEASVNTSNPKTWREEQVERTAINRLISQLLKMLPRAQYIGYTATPFANVFIDPSDAEDIFPNDFLISLPRTPGYMGSADFQDIDSTIPDGERNFRNSNIRAHIRTIPLKLPEDRWDVRAAMDTFVLAGAVKLYREKYSTGEHRVTFKHHTMLVHENAKTTVQREHAKVVRELWDTAGYTSPSAYLRLKSIFDNDLIPVMRVRSGGYPVPADFDDLRPFLADAVNRIGDTGNPVLVVNSDKIEGENVDFDRPGGIWRILVGGNKLARGFTVEGLTVSYYRRLTKQGSTLMQMGRWFGYRTGYRDLVRLYITDELNEAFEAVCRDEEYFRRQLQRYAEPVDGRPQLTPAQVPPLVGQHLPWLKPTAPNKMYNARLTERRSPGMGIEPTAFPDRPVDLAHNARAFKALLDAATRQATFKSSARGTFASTYGIVEHPTLIAVLDDLRWADDENFSPDLAWLRRLDETRLRDWCVMFPQLGDDDSRRSILGSIPTSIFRRQRRRPPYFGAISDPKHRVPTVIITGGVPEHQDPEAQALWRPHRGAMLVYPIYPGGDTASGGVQSPIPGEQDIDPGAVVMAFRLLAPNTALVGDLKLLTFETKDSRRPQDAIVDKAR